jgi:hypothetical protein
VPALAAYGSLLESRNGPLADDTEVTDVFAFFKVLKVPVNIKAYKYDVTKPLHTALSGFIAKIKAAP